MSIYSGDTLLVTGKVGLSAYQQAVNGGYEGSEEDFQKLLNNIPSTAKQSMWDDAVRLHRQKVSTGSSTYYRYILQNVNGSTITNNVASALSLSDYAKADHTHSEYATADHTHDGMATTTYVDEAMRKQKTL